VTPSHARGQLCSGKYTTEYFFLFYTLEHSSIFSVTLLFYRTIGVMFIGLQVQLNSRSHVHYLCDVTCNLACFWPTSKYFDKIRIKYLRRWPPPADRTKEDVKGKYHGTDALGTYQTAFSLIAGCTISSMRCWFHFLRRVPSSYCAIFSCSYAFLSVISYVPYCISSFSLYNVQMLDEVACPLTWKT